jgi:hypothetical protein
MMLDVINLSVFTLSTLPAALAADGENAADVKLVVAIHEAGSEHQYCD